MRRIQFVFHAIFLVFGELSVVFADDAELVQTHMSGQTTNASRAGANFIKQALLQRNTVNHTRTVLDEEMAANHTVPDSVMLKIQTCSNPRRQSWGSTMDWRAQRNVMYEAVRTRFLEAKDSKQAQFNVCEEGFGPGFSAIMFLDATTDPTNTISSHLYEFTLNFSESGFYEVPAKCSKETIERDYAGRHTITLGPTNETVPKFAAGRNAGFCDVVHIDAGHSYDDVKWDIHNIMPLIDAKTVLLFDDLTLPPIRKAIDESVTEGLLRFDSEYTIEIKENDPNKSLAVDPSVFDAGFHQVKKSFAILRKA